MATMVNGVDVDVLKQTVGAVKQDGELGQCCFRARNRWLAGNKNVGTVQDFYAAKQEMQHATKFETLADEPPILAGHDSAANPVEHLLTALAACLTTSLVAHAAVRGIELQEVESEIEGDLDLKGFLGLSPNTPRGYQNIRVSFRVQSDADPKQLEELARFSPVFNTVVNGANVDLKIENRPASQATSAEQQGPTIH